MTNDKAIVTIEFSSYWRCSTGRGIAAALDSVVARDVAGLPMVPGRTLKGILRDAVSRLYGPVLEDMLFGSSGFDRSGEEPLPLTDTFAGRLQVSSAYVDERVRAWMLAQPTPNAEAAAMRETLFTSLAQTAIDDSTGTAKDYSLRVVEVALPVILTAEISLLPSAQGEKVDELPTDWVAKLDEACCLIEGIGGSRTRGLGRCAVKVEAA